MKKTCTLLLIALFTMMQISAQTTLYVRTSGNDANNGSSWSLAKSTLKGALEAATAPATILVEGGTYKISEQLELKAGVSIEGSYRLDGAGNATRPLIGAKAWEFASPTILDAKETCRIASAAALETATVIDGLTFKNGKTAAGELGGGAILFVNNITLKKCSFINNSAIGTATSNGGGGALNITGQATIEDSYFFANYGDGGALGGGAIYAKTTTQSSIDRCVFEGNYYQGSASLAPQGGAVSLATGSLFSISNTTFFNNKAQKSSANGGAYGNGGALTSASTLASINNCVFFNNSGASSVHASGKFHNNTVVNNIGAIQNVGSGITNLCYYNNLIWGNINPATSAAAGITVSSRTILAQNNAAIAIEYRSGSTYENNLLFASNSDNNAAAGEEKIGGPKFVNPTSFVGVATNDAQAKELTTACWRLLEGSSVLTAGSATIALTTTDMCGNVRPSTNISVGAHEGISHLVTATANAAEGIVLGAGGYFPGSQATLVAKPATAAYAFKCWKDASDQVVSTNPVYTFNVTANNMAFTAEFESAPFLTFRTNNTSSISFDVAANTAGKSLYVDWGDGVKNLIDNDVSLSDKTATTVTGTATGLVKVYGEDLWYFYMTNKKITEIDLRNATSLKEIHLQLNTFTKEIDLNNLSNLRYFDCSGTTSTPTINNIDITNNLNLEQLIVNNNPGLGDFDLSANILLTNLQINNIGRKSLDITKHTALTTLQASTNSLKVLDISKNVNLKTLLVADNQLTAIDVSTCPLIGSLNINNNQIPTLDISMLAPTSNMTLNANGCGLTSVNAVGNTKLKTVNMTDNKLTSLDLSTTVVTYLNLSRNEFSSKEAIVFPTAGTVNSITTCKIDNNKYKLSTLPNDTKIRLASGYAYQPQPAYALAATATTDDVLDLSSENNLMGVLTSAQTTTYSWATTTGTALTEGTDYTVTEAGKFKFITVQPDGAVCTMATAAFPNFSGANAYKTTAVVINAGTGIKSAGLNSKVYGIKGAIMIHDFEGSTVEIFNLQGTKVGTWAASSNQMLLPINEGVYFVKVEQATQKVIVK